MSVTSTPAPMIRVAEKPKAPPVQRPQRLESLRLHPRAFLKIRTLADFRPEEVSFMCVTAPSDPLYVMDVDVIRQEVSGVTTDWDMEGYEEYINARVEAGVDLATCTRVWGHTHPDIGVNPSGVDWATFHEDFCNQPFAVMFIYCTSGKMGAHLRVRLEGTKTYIVKEIPVQVDWDALAHTPAADVYTDALRDAWEAEHTRLVSTRRAALTTYTSCSRWDSYLDDRLKPSKPRGKDAWPDRSEMDFQQARGALPRESPEIEEPAGYAPYLGTSLADDVENFYVEAQTYDMPSALDKALAHDPALYAALESTLVAAGDLNPADLQGALEEVTPARIGEHGLTSEGVDAVTSGAARVVDALQAMNSEQKEEFFDALNIIDAHNTLRF